MTFIMLRKFPSFFLISFMFFKNLFIYLFIYFWLRWVFVAARGLSLVAASGGCSSSRCAGFSLRWLLLLRSTGCRREGARGLSSCGNQAPQLWLVGSRVQAQQLWCTGLVAPRHVGSSRTRALTRVPCIGRRILNHFATREVPVFLAVLCNMLVGSQFPDEGLNPVPPAVIAQSLNHWTAREVPLFMFLLWKGVELCQMPYLFLFEMVMWFLSFTLLI